MPLLDSRSLGLFEFVEEFILLSLIDPKSVCDVIVLEQFFYFILF